jgi:superfamily II DNA or RNA helicase
LKLKLSNNLKVYSPPKWLLKTIEKEYKVINPVWKENHRMGRWNRGVDKFLHFYEKRKGFIILPIGEAETIMQLLTKKNIPFSIHDKRIEKKTDLFFTGKLKDFQADTMLKVLEYNNGTIEAATGSGKTVMGLFAIAYRKQKTLVLVHTKDLAYQWAERAGQFLNIKPFEIGMIGNGKKTIGQKLTIGMVQSCCKNTKMLSKQFGMVVSDECHRSPSKTFTDTLSELHCAYRLGLTATPFRRDGLNKMIGWYCGPIRHIVDKKMLIKEGHIMQPLFIMKGTDFETDIDPVDDYSKMLSELTGDSDRNTLIVKDIVRYTANREVCALVLSDRKQHCYLLETYLKNKGLNPLVLTGDVKTADRKEITSQIGKGANILIATGQLIGEGFDCKNLNMLFICSPIKFSGRVLQYIGRIMRPAKGKDRPVVYDYVDYNIPTLERSANSRIKVYGKENIQYE